LLIDLMTTGVWLATVSIVAVQEFGISPSAAFTTSGVLIAVVGFAVRSLLADLFYGLTMAVERPFEIGHWVKLTNGLIGRVDTMTWRAVKLVTKDNLRVVVPNASLAGAIIINYDQPTRPWRHRLRVVLDHDVPAERVKGLLDAAVRQVPACAALPQKPEAVIEGLSGNGVEWELRFWLPDYDSSTQVRQRIVESIQQHLRFAGIRVARSQEHVLIGSLHRQLEEEQAAAGRWIELVDLFRALGDDQRGELQRRALSHRVPAGTAIVKQREPGSSLYVIREGALDVMIADSKNAPEKVGTMGPGSVFGELSLLTGEPRSATVVAATAVLVHEIRKEDIEPILQAHPELARHFAEVVTDRRLADERRINARTGQDLDRVRAGMIESLLDKAREFFKLKEFRARVAAK
jgi:CRP-like cAMP-binding protein